MNADRLLTHYERIADAPHAIVCLRRFILDLAVRGKLVEQDLNDEPASIFLAGGKRCKSQEFRAADAPGWLVYPVGSLLEFKYGKGMKASERLNEGPVPVFGSNGIVGYCETPLTEAPSIIVGRKGSAGALNLCNGPSWTTDVAYFVEAPNFFDLQYLLIGLQGFALGSLGKGIKPGLSRSDAYDLPLSVPPLAEQRRIVAKVDKLMALCDRLEAARAEREATRDRLSAASLARLDVPDPDPTVFQGHAAFALKNFAPLTSRLDRIKGLRQTILNLAVRGKLVEQDPNDEPASELLKRIAAEKARLVKSGKIREPKIVMPLEPEERLFPTPKGWSWVRLREIGITQTGTTPSSSKPELFGNFIPFVKPADLDGPSINYDGPGLSEEGMNHSRVAPAGTVMMVCIGATLGKVNVTDRPVCFNQQINSITPYLGSLFTFLSLALKSSNFQAQAWSKAGVGTLPIVSKGKWEVLPIPLPPLSEQRQIIAKVDELMALCDRLEASVGAAGTARHCLLESLLQDALEPAANELEVAK